MLTINEHERLLNANACDAGVKYANQYDTLQEAWDACVYGPFMIWWLAVNYHADSSRLDEMMSAIVVPYLAAEQDRDAWDRIAHHRPYDLRAEGICKYGTLYDWSLWHSRKNPVDLAIVAEVRQAWEPIDCDIIRKWFPVCP